MKAEQYGGKNRSGVSPCKETMYKPCYLCPDKKLMKSTPRRILLAANRLSFRVQTIVFAGILLWTSCEKDPPLPPPPFTSSGNSVLVLNEGNFNWGNASIDLLDLKSGKLHEDVFQAMNHRPLGDVLQSMRVIDHEAWLVLNNSMKIERINLLDFKSVSTVASLQSPRYLLPLDGKVYVSDLYAGKIHILDRVTGAKKGSIPCSGWTEGMLARNDEAWVCNTRKGKVYVINSMTDQIIDSVHVGDLPQTLVADKNGQIWVLCQGDIPPNETAGSLWKIDPSTRSVLATFNLPDASHPSSLCINASGEVLYFILNGIYKVPVDAASWPTSAWVSQGQRRFYGLSVNHTDGSIWVSDAKDYVQRGEIIRYAESGEITGTWLAGIIPRDFYFY
jgi:hypothetical protein